MAGDQRPYLRMLFRDEILGFRLFMSCQGSNYSLELKSRTFCSFINFKFQIIFLQVHGMHAMRVTNFPHLNHLKEIYLASISSNRCSASSRSKSKIKKPIRKMPKPRIFPRFCKCWNLKKKEKGEGKTVIRDTRTACTISPTREQFQQIVDR